MKIEKGQKIFVSSTAYDLIDLRAEVLNALPNLGFTALGHENAGFPIPFGMHSHDVCLEAVKHCDMFLLTISGRYGGIYNGNNQKYKDSKWSITRCEADVAFNLKKGVLIYVRDRVWNERKSYNDFKKSGKPSEDFIHSHVDNTEIFEFINDAQHRSGDNWMTEFNNSVQLKNHLRGRLTGETPDIFNAAHFKTYDNEG